MSEEKKITFEPLFDRVLVKQEDAQEVKRGSFIITDESKERPNQGDVVAVGKGKINDSGFNVPVTVKAGDKILFGKYSGSKIVLDNVEYIVMRESDIIGIIHDDTATEEDLPF